jgi:hypothetical protein
MSGGLMLNVSASKPRDHEFEPYTVHNNVTSYDTRTGWFQEADSKEIYKDAFKNDYL